jgi:hypothetical protein
MHSTLEVQAQLQRPGFQRVIFRGILSSENLRAPGVKFQRRVKQYKGYYYGEDDDDYPGKLSSSHFLFSPENGIFRPLKCNKNPNIALIAVKSIKLIGLA